MKKIIAFVLLVALAVPAFARVIYIDGPVPPPASGTSPVAVVQSVSGSFGNATQSSIQTNTTGGNVAAGNLLVYVVWYSKATAETVTITGTDWSGYVEAGNCHTGTYGMRWGYKANTTGGAATNATATFSGTVDYPAMWVKELSGASTSSPYTSGESIGCVTQSAPGAGTNKLSSGNTPTLSAAPAYVLGFSMSLTGTEIPTAGTGYASINTVWNYANDFDTNPPFTARTYGKSTPNTSPVAATASLATGTEDFATWVMVIH